MPNPRIWKADEVSPAKQYLMAYQMLVKRREALGRELERLREATVSATAYLSPTGAVKTHNPSANENAILRVMDGEQKLVETMEHIGEALAVRLVLIERLTDERHKTVLTLRYINGLGWEQIGYDVHYERTQLFAIHTAALEAFAAQMTQTVLPCST